MTTPARDPEEDDSDYEWPLLDDDQVRELCAALGSLHRQAHPDQASGVRVCREEPCRSLSLDVVSEIDGA